tara:strand:- start:173 stop:457 length:285 start_codon:yes stop_codon:yes gene_type:complete
MHKNIPNIFTFISNFDKKEILNLDKKIGIIFRNYERNYDKNKILELKEFCKKNRMSFYLANNPKLAITLDLDGVYIPSFNKSMSIRIFSKKKIF